MSKTVKIVYLILFTVLVIHPHVNTGHILPIPSNYVQSLINLLLVGIAAGIYFFHQRDIKHKEEEKKRVEKKLDISSEKLMDAFKYIGLANRRLPLLKNLTSDLLARFESNKKTKQNIFDELLATAVTSIVKADWGMFRFVNIKTKKTAREFVYTNGDYTLFKIQIANSELVSPREHSAGIKKINDLYILPTSDCKALIQCFIFLPQTKIAVNELPVLQAIVDQAQLFYQYLFNNKH